MNILGLTIGEVSSAALLRDGKIVACASEERFTRKKGDESYPKNAIDYCLKEAGINGSDLDEIAIAGLSLAFGPWVTRSYTSFSIEDHIRAQNEYWYPKLYEGKDVKWTDVFADKLDLDQFPGNFRTLIKEDDSYYSDKIWPQLRDALHAGIAEHIGIDPSIIKYYEHHSCHAAYAYWGSPLRDETLVLTMDAYGDGLSATANVAKDGKITRFFEAKDSNFKLARIYRYITLLLGMKPNEHEYKVMGLAPYAKPQIWKKPYEVFKNTMYVDGLEFKWKDEPKDMYFYFKEKLEGCRFDGIAGALQKYTEEILTEWFKNAIKESGCGRVVFSGGISMNIKANMLLQDLDEVDDFFVCGSGSDESLSMGCAMQAYAKSGDPEDLEPVSMYLGPQTGTAEVQSWVEDKGLKDLYHVEYGIDASRIAELLAQKKVLGRCAGRMEFGARALGNRSILADPRDRDIVEVINHKIKNRDFWMPFAGTVLSEYQDDYLLNSKKIRSPFMTIGFSATAKGKQEMAAAVHVADKTIRPQILEKDHNPEYYQIVDEFRKITGVPALLNTSFNLHGSPIVMTPDDALHVLENSEIDGIVVENTLILRKN